MTSENSLSWNEDIDRAITQEGVLDSNLFGLLADAIGYDAATSVQWAEHKLGLFRERLQQGKIVKAYVPGRQELAEIHDLSAFDAYAEKYFELTCNQRSLLSPGNSRPSR